jgi:hypothetical protein
MAFWQHLIQQGWTVKRVHGWGKATLKQCPLRDPTKNGQGKAGFNRG